MFYTSATYPVHLILIDLFTKIIYCEEKHLRSSVKASVVGPNILPRTLVLSTFNTNINLKK
jgi:hypothetical protein